MDSYARPLLAATAVVTISVSVVVIAQATSGPRSAPDIHPAQLMPVEVGAPAPDSTTTSQSKQPPLAPTHHQAQTPTTSSPPQKPDGAEPTDQSAESSRPAAHHSRDHESRGDHHDNHDNRDDHDDDQRDDRHDDRDAPPPTPATDEDPAEPTTQPEAEPPPSPTAHTNSRDAQLRDQIAGDVCEQYGISRETCQNAARSHEGDSGSYYSQW